MYTIKLPTSQSYAWSRRKYVCNVIMQSGYAKKDIICVQYITTVACLRSLKKEAGKQRVNNGDLTVRDVKYSPLTTIDNRSTFCILNYYLFLPDNLVPAG